MAFEIDPVEDLAAALEWLVDVVGDGSPQPIRRLADPAAVAAPIAEVERRIAPYTLPAEIRWFWTTWEPWGFDFLPMPCLDGPEGALVGWQAMVWEMPGPRALFPIAYASHEYALVDLTGPPGIPASLWEGDGLDPFECIAPSLAAMVRSCAERIEVASVDDRDLPPGPDRYGHYDHLLGGPELRSIVDRHFAASGAGRTTVPMGPPAAWPEPWRRAQKAIGGGSDPQGATHTVAGFAEQVAAGEVRARIRGILEFMGGLEDGPGHLVRVSDETGTLYARLDQHLLPPGWTDRRTVEIEVVGRGRLPERPWTTPPDPEKVARMTDRYGSWDAYLWSEEGRNDPDVEASVQENIRATETFKAQVPVIERIELVDP